MEKAAAMAVGFSAGVFLTIVWYDTVKEWWRDRKLPYRAVCDLCTDGAKFICKSNNIVSTDRMILEHKEQFHAG